MDFAHVLAFNLTLLAAIASPGPSLLFLIRTSMAEGRSSGVAAAMGLGLMAALWTLAALLGLEALFTLFPWAFVTVKIAGALYLLWIAVHTWRHAREPVPADGSTARSRAFRQGMLVNLANPKSVLFSAAVIVVIFPDGLTTGEKALIFLNHLGVEWLVQPALALGLSTGVVRRRYLSLKPVLDRAAALVLAGLGGRLLLDR